MPKWVIIIIAICVSIFLFFLGWFVIDKFQTSESTEVDKMGEQIESDYQNLKNDKMPDKNSPINERFNDKGLGSFLGAVLHTQDIDLFSQLFDAQKFNDMLMDQPSGKRFDYIEEIMNELSKNQTIASSTVKQEADRFGVEDESIDITFEYENGEKRQFEGIPIKQFKDHHTPHVKHEENDSSNQVSDTYIDRSIPVFNIRPDEITDYEVK